MASGGTGWMDKECGEVRRGIGEEGSRGGGFMCASGGELGGLGTG